MKVIRENTRKKNIANNISNNTGLPLNYSLKIVDDIITMLATNIITKKIFKINS